MSIQLYKTLNAFTKFSLIRAHKKIYRIKVRVLFVYTNQTSRTTADLDRSSIRKKSKTNDEKIDLNKNRSEKNGQMRDVIFFRVNEIRIYTLEKKYSRSNLFVAFRNLPSACAEM